MESTVVSPRDESQGCARAPRMVRRRIDGPAQQHDWLAAEPALPECLFARNVTAWNTGSQLSLPCNSILRMRREVELFEANPIDRAQWSKPQTQSLLINAWWRTRTRRSLLCAVRELYAPLEAFHGCLY